MIGRYLIYALVGFLTIGGISVAGYIKGHEAGYRKGVDEYVRHITRMKTAQDKLRKSQVDAMNEGLIVRERKYKELESEYAGILRKYKEGQTDETKEWNVTPVPELYRD